MSLTIEFYSAEPEGLKTLFAEESSLSVDDFFQRQQTFPQADFSFHILVPDDLDNLCQILNKYSPLVPSRFQDVGVGTLWDDGQGTESLTLLSEQFTHALAECNQEDIEQVALQWAATFPFDKNLESFRGSLPYLAVQQLQYVAQDALRYKRSLIYHLAGAPAFFEYLRDL